ncbi:MAG: hypothetical protein JWQ35_1085 [Bacteriovoracaceae bacterium]|nr:hypothetical protein [Bacteriovoracaceae bacterium]
MIKFYREGDHSRGICKVCKAVVDTTFKITTVPLMSGKGKVEGVLAAACDQCGALVSVPQQSTARIQEGLFGKRCRVEVRIPKHLRDILLTICTEIASDVKPTEIEPFVMRYYMAHIASNKLKVACLKKHLRSKFLEGRANDRVSFRVSEQILKRFGQKLKMIKINQTEAIKAIILQAKMDLLDKAAPRRLREIVLSASAA